MELRQVWGALLILIVCPLLGGLPLIEWITYLLTRRRLSRLGTRNVSVSAAFYHGGKLAGIAAVLSEALKGVLAVGLARVFFSVHPWWQFSSAPEWDMVALIALVMGRYWISKGAGTTNVVWGYVLHDPIAALLVFIVSGVLFTIFRERRQGRVMVLILFPLVTAARHPQESALIVAAIVLGGLLGWIYEHIPDDLDLLPESSRRESQAVFKFFRSDRAVVTLDQTLQAEKVGQKAATLAKLKRWGYPVPPGWVLPPGDDAEPLVNLLDPSEDEPLVVRSSAVDEDSEQASAAGQYETVLQVTSRDDLRQAIPRCLASYDTAGAIQYRLDRGMAETAMAVLIQKQVRGVFSGVAFSRDPIRRQGDAVLVEGLPGSAVQIVSGRVTPETYQVLVSEADIKRQNLEESDSWVLPNDVNLAVEAEKSEAGNLPPRLVQQVAFLARHLEARYHGIPQDIEWSYDGQTLWLLQSRPITTLLPIWTRKIAAEVIPGLIRPLTWSINRPLTCGVWGDLFAVVLGERSRGLDFNETATLHYSRAYFNASLLGQTFLRMGLPPESLEFLTRGSKFSKPPLSSTLRNLPGLLQLLRREFSLEQDFARDDRTEFTPILLWLAEHPAHELSDVELLDRMDRILAQLKRATYYSILAPLSAALRKAVSRVKDEELDNGKTPEVAALRSLQSLAWSARQVLGELGDWGDAAMGSEAASSLFTLLAETSGGEVILDQFNQLLDRYGYLSEVGTDIAVPTWKEAPQPVQELFAQFCLNPPPAYAPPRQQSGKVRGVQRRIDLKGRVTEVYSRLLAELRWSFVALEHRWLQAGWLQRSGDIFFLEFAEVRRLIEENDQALVDQLPQQIEQRRKQLEQDGQIEAVPSLVYGNDPPTPTLRTWQASQQLQGIGASPGQVEGRVKVLQDFQSIAGIDRETILVVPYTDSGWAPLLARAGGLISEVGGRLSHGAIVAREYRIPAVMDVHNATRQLRNGQWVRIDGVEGTIEIL
jgi:phosphoenolpyruvate synthase/pyruvate phosphate dikinase/glycerol-3-phosphate acyltransferase PlsY